MNTFTVRKSSIGDEKDISSLLKQCFGDRDKYGAIDCIQNRYLLTFDGEKLVAMTGVCGSEISELNGSEIDWTCCDIEYRNKHLISNMLKTLLSSIDEPVYCSAWHEHNKEFANMHYILTKFGFTCVKKSHKSFNKRFNSACDDCVNCTSLYCTCCEDLYMRK